MNSPKNANQHSDLSQDDQGALVQKILGLADRINRACFADVEIKKTETYLHVNVVEYWRNEPTINETFGLAESSTANATSAVLLARLEKVAGQLQAIFNRGDRREAV